MRRPDHINLCSIAGSDPTGGAGLQGDLKTFAAQGVRGTAVVTAVTVQGARGVSRVVPIAAEVVAEQLAVVLAEVRPAAVKTGMLWDGATVQEVARVLGQAPDLPKVIDPVLAASAGGALLQPDALAALRSSLLPLATVLTPNLPEAARLLGLEQISDAEADEAARALLDLGPQAVLLKGGHGSGVEAIDVLATRRGVERFGLPRIAGIDPHGTGCALSAALAARLARGETLSAAVRAAKAYVHRAIQASRGGPLVHAVPAD
jgi:hydroxymethylpyrimidine/phosphomethylpyrimidine kinase